MTKIGEFLKRRSVNNSEIARKTGLSNQRIGELSNNTTTKLRADELYLIALAIEVNPADLLDHVCGHLQLKRERK